MPKSSSSLDRIDPASWTVTILPLPKGCSRGAAYGFCGGHAVGRAERLRSPSVGCWWPNGKAELLTLPDAARVGPGRASGNTIPGQWSIAEGETGAAAWTLHHGELVGRRLDAAGVSSSWGTVAAGDVVVGTANRQGQRNVGLVWRGTDAAVMISAEGDVALHATNGVQFAGNIRGRAMLWPAADAAPIDLSPAGMPMSDVQAFDGETQVGTAWKGMRPRAAMWSGTAASFRDLTPPGFQVAQIFDAAHGLQVGMVRVKENTRNDTPGSDNRAAIWSGSADAWFDLNALLPADTYNASTALAIEVTGNSVRIAGTATRYEVQGEGTPHESHVVPGSHAAMWAATLTAR